MRRASELASLPEFVYGAELANIAGKLAARNGEDDRARMLLESAAQADPDDRSHAQYARDYLDFLVQHQEFGAARAAARNALAHNPDDAPLRKLGETAGWFDAIRRALSGSSAPIRCPVNNDDDLAVEWATDRAGVAGRLYCPSCHATVNINVPHTK